MGTGMGAWRETTGLVTSLSIFIVRSKLQLRSRAVAVSMLFSLLSLGYEKKQKIIPPHCVPLFLRKSHVSFVPLFLILLLTNRAI